MDWHWNQQTDNKDVGGYHKFREGKVTLPVPETRHSFPPELNDQKLKFSGPWSSGLTPLVFSALRSLPLDCQ